MTQDLQKAALSMLHEDSRIAGVEIRDLGPGQRSCVGMPSQGEDKLTAEIDDLQRNKLEGSECNRDGFNPGLSKDER